MVSEQEHGGAEQDAPESAGQSAGQSASETDGAQPTGDDQQAQGADESDLAGLQEAQLDSVQGGGHLEQPLMNLQDSELDTVEKSDDPDALETKSADDPPPSQDASHQDAQ